MMTVVVLVVVICVLFEAFFSGSEIAVVSADRRVLKEKAARGDRGAALALRLLADAKTLLSTTLVGTNLSVVTATVTVTLHLLMTHPAMAEIDSLVIMSPTLLLLGEVVPKSLFQQHSNVLATKVVYPLVVFRWLFAPILLVVTGFTSVVTRLLGVKGDRPLVTREELQDIIETVGDEREGEITAGEAEMISNVLAVEDRMVEQVMIPLSEVCSLDVECSVMELVHLARDKKHTRMPIYSERIDNIIGIVHVFDLIDVDPSKEAIRDLMQQPTFVPETQLVLDFVSQLQRVGQEMAVVVNEYGGAEGVVTLEDAIEEIVGEIEDEYDTDWFSFRQEHTGVICLEGRVPVEHVNKRLGLTLPEDEEYETMAGLVLDRIKRMPRVGDRVQVGQADIEVTRVTDRAIKELRVTMGRRRQS